MLGSEMYRDTDIPQDPADAHQTEEFEACRRFVEGVVAVADDHCENFGRDIDELSHGNRTEDWRVIKICELGCGNISEWYGLLVDLIE